MSVHVCDCIMGAGKSSASITYINEHPDDKIIYITPYLDEANRIHRGCPKAHFVEPSNKLSQYDFKKSTHTMALIKEGKNITTTHQAFKRYTQETLNDIKQQGYVLIIDENVEVLEPFEFHPDDLQMAVDAGYITEKDGIYSIANDNYHGNALAEIFSLLKSRELIRMEDDDTNLYYWALPPDLLTSFKDVYIMTYLFEGQSLHHFMEIYHIPYSYIGIERTDDGGYRFGELPGYVPEYITHIKDKIHIVDGKVNNVGDDRTALSLSWFNRGGSGVSQLKKNVSNIYNNVWREQPAEKRLWGSFNKGYTLIKGKGYSKSFLPFNTKATNKFRDRVCLVYAVNIFMNVNEKKFYYMHGIEVDEDKYALSIMVQWIWRSAIRDGNEVYLYIPSKRMRTILENWMNDLSREETDGKAV